VITFSNGHKFKFMTASGALAYDGHGWPWEKPLRWAGLLDPSLFTNVTKTLTRSPREGNLRWSHPWSVVKALKGGGVVNAIGLTNPGIDWWIEKVAPKIPENFHLVASIEARDELEVAEMIQLLEGQRIRAIELNLSCPNTKDHADRTTSKILTICRHAAKMAFVPLIAKLSYTHDYVAMARELEKERHVEAISINSVPWAAIFQNRSSPLARFGGGGVSGRTVQKYTWTMVEEIAKSTKIPVIGPSVWNYEDIQRVTDRGAKAVSFGSVFVRHPWRPTRFVRRWINENVREHVRQ
jgi:dihydroorotate dehydrogenase (NAD+) catalytic subunit